VSGNVIGGVIGLGLAFVSGGLISPAWGWMIGSVAGGILFPQAGPDGPRLDDLKPQSSEFGRPIPIVYGTVAIAGNVIWASDLIEVEGDSGGKGGGGGGATFTYYANFAVAICEGEVALGRIWAGPEKRLIYDGSALEGKDAGAVLRFYQGTEDQLPDPLIESFEGVGNVPAYRGTAYLVLEHFPVLKDGNRIPFLTIEVGHVQATPNTAREDMAYSWAYAVLVTDQYFIAFHSGMNNGFVVRELESAGAVINPFYRAYHYNLRTMPLDFTDPAFFDEDRRRLVMINRGSFQRKLQIYAIDTLDKTDVEFAPTPGVSATGPYIRAGVYHNGKYIFLGSGTPIGGWEPNKYPTIYVLDPDSLDVAEATYTYGAPNEIAVGPLYAPLDGSNYVCGFQTPAVLRKYTLGPGSTVADIGACATAPPYTASMPSGIDPYTGYIWSWSFGADKILHVYVNDPTTEASISIPPPLPDYFSAVYGITFQPGSPSKAIFYGTRIHHPFTLSWAWDGFAYYDGDTGDFDVTVDGGNSWLAIPIQTFWNPLENYFHAIHRGGIVSTGLIGVGDGLNVSIPGPDEILGSFDDPPTPTNYYLGHADESVDLDLHPQSLASIVSDLSVRSGLTANQIDVTELIDMVDGYAIASQTSTRDAITALMPAYFFDAVESDGLVKYVKRGGPIAVEVPDDDVGCFESGTQSVDPLETVRRMEVELPRTMNVKYLLEATDYSPAIRTAKRLVGSSGEEQTMELPLVLSDTQAQEIAEVNLHGAWVARLTYSFTLPRKYGYLEPTDIVAVYGHTMRLTKTVAKDGVIQCEAVHDDSNVYTPHVVVTETPPSIIVVPGGGGGVEVLSETVLELA
jgi:hypothetical protein